MSKRLLFLCTGNYYRSRFAEILFNHLAVERQLDWHADSRGLARDFGMWNVGPMSPHTISALRDRQVVCPDPLRDPMHCFEQDFSSADLVVALKEAEHRPMMVQHFPDWENRIEYWHVHDLDAATPDQAMAEIDRHVRDLIERLSQ